MTMTIIEDQDDGEGMELVFSSPTLNLESLKFLAENPESIKLLTSSPVHHEVLNDQATFNFWRTMCEKRQYAVNDRIPAKHFSPAMLKWYMERQVTRQKTGRNERNISRHGHYHVAGKSLICPCPELIALCADNEIVVKPCFCDPKSLNAIRRGLRTTTIDDYARVWNELGLPLKKTSSILTGKVHNAEGKMFVTYIADDVPRIKLMLFFAKIYGYENAVKPGVRNALSHEDEQKVSGLTKADEKLARPVPEPKVKLSKADLKLMNRGRKKKKNKKGKKSKQSAQKIRAIEMNRKHEILRLKREMGIDQTKLWQTQWV